MRARAAHRPHTPRTVIASIESITYSDKIRVQGLKSYGAEPMTVLNFSEVTMAHRSVARVAVAAVLMFAASSTAFAQHLDSASDNDTPMVTKTVAWTVPANESSSPQPRFVLGEIDKPKRPALLLPLYVSAGALQVMDMVSTSRGLNAGAYETNAAIRGGNRATTIALKAATTGLGVVIAEKMWKKNKMGAVAAMIVTNVVSAAVVANNYRVMQQIGSAR